jgi:hypothetical protein
MRLLVQVRDFHFAIVSSASIAFINDPIREGFVWDPIAIYIGKIGVDIFVSHI